MIAAARLEAIQASNEALHAHLEQALSRIEQNVHKNKELAERISRSPREIKTIQALEAALAVFERNHPEPEYRICHREQTLEMRPKCSPCAHHRSTGV
jgi:hypothetical protein